MEHQEFEKDTVSKQNLETTSTNTRQLKIESEGKCEALKAFDAEAGRLDFMENTALWPKVLTDLIMIEFVIHNKPL